MNRSELEGLADIEGTIYVTGHKSPDTDTVCSSIAYATLLRELGYDAQPVVLGNINKETEYILATAGIEVPELMVDASGENMVLVDHSEYEHSADGLASKSSSPPSQRSWPRILTNSAAYWDSWRLSPTIPIE